MIEQRVTLRYGAQQIPAIVQAVQGDTGRDVIFELADYEIPAGATANYYIDKPDGNAVYNSAEVISSTEILAHLTEQALAEPGRNNGQVRILFNGEVITSFDFVLEVEVFRGILHMRSATEVNIFDAAIQEAVDDAIEEIQAQTPVVTGMQNSIAPTYSSSSTYAVGDYVMYNAQLYRCITAITTAEAWTEAHWIHVPIASEVSDLKSALINNTPLDWQKGLIDLSNGRTYASDTSIRTAKKYKTRFLNSISVANGYKIGVVYYNADKSYAGYKNWTTGDFVLSKTHPYFDLCMQKVDGSNISVSEAAASVFSIYFNENEINKEIVPNYSDLTYPVNIGTLCVWKDTIYCCNSVIRQAELFNSQKWDAVPMSVALNRCVSSPYPVQITPEYLYTFNIADIADIKPNSFVSFSGAITNAMVTNLPLYGAPSRIGRISMNTNSTIDFVFAYYNTESKLFVNTIINGSISGQWLRIDNGEIQDEIALIINKMNTLRDDLGVLDYTFERGTINSTNGNTDSNVAVRMTGNVYVGAGSVLQIDVSENISYKVCSSDSATIGSGGEILSGYRKEKTVVANKDYVRFAFVKFESGDYVVLPLEDAYKECSVKIIEQFKEATELIKPDGAKGAINPNGDPVYGDNYQGIVFSLNTIVGQRYRIKKDTNAKIRIAFKGLRSGNNHSAIIENIDMFEFVATATNTYICMISKGETPYTAVEAKEAFEYYQINRKPHDYYDVIVAASNSSQEDKMIADIVCDGVNDEVEINNAINCNVFNSYYSNVLLMPGDYYIGSFLAYSPLFLDQPTSTYGYGAIQTLNGLADDLQWRYGSKIEGKHSSKIWQGRSGAVIHVSSSLISSLSDDTEYSVFTAVRGGSNPYGYLERKIFNEYKNISVTIDGYSKNVIAFDGVGNYSFQADGCSARTTLSGSAPYNWDDIEPLPSNLIGFRTDTGENFGTDEIISRCLSSGFHEAFALEGEHILMQNCGAMWSEIGISVCTRNTYGNVGHSSVCIDNTIERCGRLMLIGYEGLQYESVADPMPITITYIGGSQEMAWKDNDNNDCYTKPILEVVKNCCAGYIGMEMYGMENTPYGNRICEDGSCNMMKVVNEHQKHMRTATSPSLPVATQCQPGTEIWDAVNGKMLWATANGWKDAAGNIVT